MCPATESQVLQEIINVQHHQAFKELKWKKFPVLDDGFICLVDTMGDDTSIVQAARVSYGAGTKKVSDDRGLIRYLMRHRHTTPLEMVELKFLVRVPMDTWRQWIRHRTASVNEYSTRYSEAIDSQQRTQPDEWRLQNPSNKQGSSGYLEDWPEGFKYDAESGQLEIDDKLTGCPLQGLNYGNTYDKPGQLLDRMERDFQEKAMDLYKFRLSMGVAREQARKDLPLSTYTEAYWKINLHNLLHFLALRMDSHAQKEIRDYATIIGEQILKPLLPVMWEAFEDYRLNAMYLTRLEKDAIKSLLKNLIIAPETVEQAVAFIENKRERNEAYDKIQKLINVL